MLATLTSSEPQANLQERETMLEMFTKPEGRGRRRCIAEPDKLGYAVLNNVIQYGYSGPRLPDQPQGARDPGPTGLSFGSRDSRTRWIWQ